MRLNRIELENWSCHPRLEADLSDGLQILGRNGTGKTSILEAIRFVFKKTASGYSNRVKNGERSATVRLSFTHDGRRYLVEKKIFVDKASTAVMLCDETQLADNPTSVYNSLRNVLSEDILEKLLYVPQGGLTGILDRLGGKDGKVEMDRLFGLDRLERVWLKAGEELKEQEARVSVLADQLKKHPDDAGEQYAKAVEDVVKQRSESESRLKARADAAEKVERELKSCEDALGRMDGAVREIDSLKKQLGDVSVSAAENSKEAEAVAARLAELAEKERELRQLESKKSSLEKYSKLMVNLRKMGEAESKLEDVKGKIADETKMASELEASMKKRPAMEAKFTELERRLKALEAEDAERTVEVKNTVQFLEELNSLEGKAKCPRCGQRLSALHLKKERNDTADLLEKKYEHLKKLEADLANVKARHEALKADVEMCRGDDAEYARIRKAVDRLVYEKTTLVMQRDSLKAELRSDGYAGETLELVEQQVAESNRMDGSIRELRREVHSKPKLEGRHLELSAKMQELGKLKESFESRLKLIKYDPDAHERQRKEKDRLSGEKYSLKAECTTLKADLARLDERKGELEKNAEDYRRLREEHAGAERRVRKLEQAREIFHRDKGLVRYLRESFIGGLNAVLSNYYARFNQNPKFLGVSFDRDYEMLFRTTTGALSLEQVSGGEKIQLALALRIALIELMSPVRLLILDEPFGSLDEPHREVLGEALTKIAETGQLILVTHVDVESLQLHNKLELEGY